MTSQELKTVQNIPGIYFIKNIINNKYYIGQSIKIRSRLLKHISIFNSNKYDAPLYRAFSKYGLENFQYGILDTFNDKDFTAIKKKLDELEIQYILKYNSFGSNGYNQTKGGDGGILGYRMTDEQKHKMSQIAKENCVLRKEVFLKDLTDNSIIHAISITALSNITNLERTGLAKALNNKKLFKHRYLISDSEDFSYYSEKLLEEWSPEKYYNILIQYIDLTYEEIKNILGISKKTVYNYNNRLLKGGYTLPKKKRIKHKEKYG